MDTWLLTWNPRYYDWENTDVDAERMDTLMRLLDSGLAAQMEWGCGACTKIQPGDRLFIMRLGAEPKGIVASGCAACGTYRLPHWDPEKAAAGVFTQYVQIRFDRIVPVAGLLPLNVLKMACPHTNWTPMCSGIRIKPEDLGPLEDIWNGC